MSPCSPSHEGVDWNLDCEARRRQKKVLPLTREWIEMPLYLKNAAVFAVLPLTREWIEIEVVQAFEEVKEVLPLTREWIEIFSVLFAFTKITVFSLSRGSGLKYSLWAAESIRLYGSPSHEGVDWNLALCNLVSLCPVLPLTREWIEIARLLQYVPPIYRFSLSRGSGLK